MEGIIVGLVKDNLMGAMLVIAFIILIKWWLDLNRKDVERLSQTMRELTKEVKTLSHAIVKLEVQFENVNKISGKVDRLEKGINILFKERQND